MLHFFLWEILQLLHTLSLLLWTAGLFHCGSHRLINGRFRTAFITVFFCFIKKGELSLNLRKFFRVTAKTLLVCKAYLPDQIFVIVLQLIKTVLHLTDDIILGLMIHGIQSIRGKFPAHTDRLSDRPSIAQNPENGESRQKPSPSLCHHARPFQTVRRGVGKYGICKIPFLCNGQPPGTSQRILSGPLPLLARPLYMQKTEKNFLCFAQMSAYF